MRRITTVLALCTVLAGWSADEPAPVTTAPNTVPVTTSPTGEPSLKLPHAELNYHEAKETPAPAADTAPPKPPSDEDIAKIVWEEFSADNTWEIPFAADLDNLSDFPERKKDWDDFIDKLVLWPPGQVPKVEERVRNLLTVCNLEDIGQGQFEAELPLHIYTFLRKEIPKQRLKDILATMAFYPDYGSVLTTAPELNLDIGVGEQQIRQRLQILAVKMLGRILGKLPWGVAPEEENP